MLIITYNLANKFHADNIVKELAPIVGGKGGGRPDMAQAGGTQPENLNKIFTELEKLPGK